MVTDDDWHPLNILDINLRGHLSSYVLRLVLRTYYSDTFYVDGKGCSLYSGPCSLAFLDTTLVCDQASDLWRGIEVLNRHGP